MRYTSSTFLLFCFFGTYKFPTFQVVQAFQVEMESFRSFDFDLQSPGKSVDENANTIDNRKNIRTTTSSSSSKDMSNGEQKQNQYYPNMDRCKHQKGTNGHCVHWSVPIYLVSVVCMSDETPLQLCSFHSFHSFVRLFCHLHRLKKVSCVNNPKWEGIVPVNEFTPT